MNVGLSLKPLIDFLERHTNYEEQISELNKKSICQMTVSGETVGPNFITNLKPNEYVVLSGYNKASSMMFIPFISSKTGTWAFHIKKSDGASLVNSEQVEITLCYIKPV